MRQNIFVLFLAVVGVLFVAQAAKATSFVLEGTYRGIYNDVGQGSERMGVGVALGFPVDNTLDLGVAMGNLFRDAEMIYDARLRYYLTGYSTGFYVGGGYIFGDAAPREYGYVTVGYQFWFLYTELDMNKRGEEELRYVPEFGLRMRYE